MLGAEEMFTCGVAEMAMPSYFPLEIKTFQITQNPALKMAGANPSFLLLILCGKKKTLCVRIKMLIFIY